jgi:hypothetical protein
VVVFVGVVLVVVGCVEVVDLLSSPPQPTTAITAQKERARTRPFMTRNPIRVAVRA